MFLRLLLQFRSKHVKGTIKLSATTQKSRSKDVLTKSLFLSLFSIIVRPVCLAGQRFQAFLTKGLQIIIKVVKIVSDVKRIEL
jgi:hypothetical protein